jgi:threonine aldolase
MSDVQAIVKGCTKFLSSYPPRSVRQLLQEIADSPLSLERNDHYGRGGVVTEVEAQVAELLGKEAAVFMPSGTMAQQIALRVWSDLAGNRTIAYHPTAHLELYEQMAYRELHGLNAILLGEPDRLFTTEDLDAVEDPVSTLLIELPQREIGGQLPTWDELTSVCDLAREKGMRLHMDGARLWECGPYYQRSYGEIASLFDSVYVSCYKILFGLPGAVLAGPKSLIDESRIWLRRHGGNLHQQSPSAIAMVIGLERYLPRIPLYVAKAKEVSEVLREFDQVRVVPEYPPTNMMHLYFNGDPERLLSASLKIAEDRHVGIMFGLPQGGKWELSIAEGALEFEREELRDVFKTLFELSA